jgi:hypothetical protein
MRGVGAETSGQRFRLGRAAGSEELLLLRGWGDGFVGWRLRWVRGAGSFAGLGWWVLVLVLVLEAWRGRTAIACRRGVV